MHSKSKLFFLSVLISTCLLALPSFADCTGGEVIKGKNGTSYCLSKIGVNWWSAFAWCESQGMKLASMDDICTVNAEEKWLGDTGSGACPNIVKAFSGNVFAWTSLSKSSTVAYVVNPNSAALNSFGKADTNKYPLCAPK